MAHELPFTQDMHERMQNELHHGEWCVDAFVAQISRDDSHLYTEAADVAGLNEDPIVRLVRLHDLLEADRLSRPNRLGTFRTGRAADWCMKACVRVQTGWQELAPTDTWPRRVFGAGLGLIALGAAKYGIDALSAAPEPTTSTTALWFAGAVFIGVSKES